MSTADTEDAITHATKVITEHWAGLLPDAPPPGGNGAKSADPVNALDRRISLAQETTLILAGWAGVIAADRGTEHWIPLATDTLGLCAFIERHARWFSGHDAAPDCASELAGYATRVRTAVLGPTHRRFTVGPCPEVVAAENDTIRCAGELIAILRLDDALLPGKLECNVNHDHVWEPRQWIHLGRRLGLDGDAA